MSNYSNEIEIVFDLGQEVTPELRRDTLDQVNGLLDAGKNQLGLALRQWIPRTDTAASPAVRASLGGAVHSASHLSVRLNVDLPPELSQALAIEAQECANSGNASATSRFLGKTLEALERFNGKTDQQISDRIEQQDRHRLAVISGATATCAASAALQSLLQHLTPALHICSISIPEDGSRLDVEDAIQKSKAPLSCEFLCWVESERAAPSIRMKM
jgi:hypothetical protein